MPTPSLKSKCISSWPEEVRPRECLLSFGPQALTDAEGQCPPRKSALNASFIMAAIEFARRPLS